MVYCLPREEDIFLPQIQIDELSCAHAYAVLKRKPFELDNYFSDLYKSVSVLDTYEVSISPLPNRSTWEIPDYILSETVLRQNTDVPLEGQRKEKEKSPWENFTGLSPQIHAVLVG
ncbi:uncharacterized protein LOC107876414 [Capsicum annuum]|uniref:uncharacterized protein LOC107876414 n=1 Tax=Capsicum annuum TaxID=4072 RepID=UPI0007BF8B68|nr:uncharacterized protein LOC107876414 [Capsicum annuum]